MTNQEIIVDIAAKISVRKEFSHLNSPMILHICQAFAEEYNKDREEPSEVASPE